MNSSIKGRLKKNRGESIQRVLPFLPIMASVFSKRNITKKNATFGWNKVFSLMDGSINKLMILMNQIFFLLIGYTRILGIELYAAVKRLLASASVAC